MKTSRLVCLALLMLSTQLAPAQRRIYAELIGNAHWKAVLDGKTYYGKTEFAGDSRNRTWITTPPLPNLEAWSSIVVGYDKEWYEDHGYSSEVVLEWLQLQIVSRKFVDDLAEAYRRRQQQATSEYYELRDRGEDVAFVTYVHLLEMKIRDSEVLMYKDSLVEFYYPSSEYIRSHFHSLNQPSKDYKDISAKSFNKVMQWPAKKTSHRSGKITR